ncbi:MAG: flavin reductase family protein [Candidatus Saganbacteria bacterium]|nr:flavin reductase family protein [Candidatus Saganbacteria bacterium]
MSKEIWKPGTMLYPLPAVLVSSGDKLENYNILTIAWTGTICSEPAMTYVSIRPSRLSYEIIKRTGEFVINLTTRKLAFATDFCGVRSGREVNKFERLKLTAVKGSKVKAPIIAESPVNIECRVKEMKPLGSHTMFIAEVLCVHIDKEFVTTKGDFDLRKAEPICYSHGHYYLVGKHLGHFGFSVEKKRSSKT